VAILDKGATWKVLLENANGTGNTLLDNAQQLSLAYSPEHIFLNNHSLRIAP